MNEVLEQHMSSSRWYHSAVLLLLALFPVISVLVPSGGSGIYTFLALPALIFGWSGWKQLNYVEKQWALSLIALFIIATLSLLYSEDLKNGIGKLERYFRLMTIPLIYLMVRRLNIETGKLFLVGVAIASVLLALQAYYQTHQLNMSRAYGLYYPISFGDIAVLTSSILTAAVLTVIYNRWLKLITIICIFSALYAAVASGTRGAWILIPVYIALFGWLYRSKLSKAQWIKAIIILLVTILMLSLWTPRKLELGIARAYTNVVAFIDDPKTQSSAGARLNMWRNSMIIWSKSPAVGTGIGDFQLDSERLILTKESLSIEVGKYSHAHNIYFDTLATLGLFGLIVLVIALFIIPWKLFIYFWRESDAPWIRFYALSGLLTITSYAIFGLSEGWLTRNPFINPYIIYLIVFLTSITTRNRLSNYER